MSIHEPERVVFTVTELLKWAHDETELADALEILLPEGDPAMEEEVAAARRRSRWLDQQVAYFLELQEQKEQEQP